MILAESLAVALIFASGIYLLMNADLIRVAAGGALLGNAAILFLALGGLTRGIAPLLPLPPGRVPADPLVQALALTALVINFAMLVLTMSLLFRVHQTHGSLDQDRLAEAEREELHELARRPEEPWRPCSPC